MQQHRHRLFSSAASSPSSSSVDPVQAQYMEEEMCIGVTFDDKPLKPLSKKAAHLIKGKGPILHRAFSVFLFDEQGKMLLQKRAACKITFPSYWTNTCCSHPLFNAREMGEDVVAEAAASSGSGNGSGSGKQQQQEVEAAAVVGCKRAAIRKLEHELGIPAATFAHEELVYSA